MTETVPEADATDATAPEGATQADAPETEMEAFYTFTWGGNRQQNRGPREGQRRSGPPKGKGKPPRKGAPKGQGGQKPQRFEAKPPRKEKAIDPDNPFAQALMGLKKG